LRRRPVVRRLALLALACALGAGLWQSDWVRQNLELAWRRVTGHYWHVRGRERTAQVFSPALGESRAVLVYTPPGYGDPANAARRYPVLYLLHGSPDGGDGWERYGRASELVDKMIVEGQIPPLLVVCPDGNGAGRFGDSEYIDAPAVGGRPGPRIATWITHDLTAWTDGHFRTIPAARGRLLGGISEGGYGAVNLGLQRPDVFSSLVALSGYYAADDAGWARPVWGRHPDPARLRAESPQAYVSGPDPRWRDTFVYLGDGAGDRDWYRRQTSAFAARLRAAGIASVCRTAPGRHSWDLWRGLLTDALREMQARSRLPETAP